MTFGGIDPGLKGGIAILHGGLLDIFPTPTIGGVEYDLQEMKNLLQFSKKFGEVFFTLEKQMAMPGQGLSSTLKTGIGYGMWLGLLSGLNIPYQVVSPLQWQNFHFKGLSKRLDTKEMSILVAKRIYPTTDFLRSSLSRKPADGLTDASLIANFGLRTYKMEEPTQNSQLPLATAVMAKMNEQIEGGPRPDPKEFDTI